jgi:hypothetical protein
MVIAVAAGEAAVDDWAKAVLANARVEICDLRMIKWVI